MNESSKNESGGITLPDSIGILAGGGAYPRLVAEGARAAGVQHITLFAFRGQTIGALNQAVDKVHWLNIGQYGHNLDFIPKQGTDKIIMAGQISPMTLFRALFDQHARKMLKELPLRNANSIYGAIVKELAERGVKTLPSSLFMRDHIPAAGVLTQRKPTEEEQADIEFGLRIANETSRMDIGQTVAVYRGTVIAVEAFEGTSATIRRAGRQCRKGCVMVKAASPDHDMNFDIPCIGLKTITRLKRSRFSCVAMQAHRILMLEMPKVIEYADKLGIAMVAVDSALPHAPVFQPLESK